MLDIFSKRLRELIEIEGITEREFARKTGLKRKSIYNWLKELRYPRYDSLLKIAGFFNVRIDYLLGREDNMYENVKNTYQKTDAEVRSHFYMKIRKYLEEKGMTEYSFAKLLGLKQCTIQRWTREKGMPEVYHLVKIATLLNTSVDDLLGNEV